MRIHSVLIEINIAAIDQNYTSKYKLLKILYQELRPMMNPTERKDFANANNILDMANKDRNDSMNKNGKVIPGKIVNVFDDFEQALRDIIQKKNMGLPQKADSRFALKS